MYDFDKSRRLLSAQDYQPIFSDAPFRAAHPQILLLARPNQTGSARLGLVIAKKNIRKACDRNRIKRLIRESFRHRQAQLDGLDIIALARRDLDSLDNERTFKLLDKQWRRLTRKRDSESTPSRPKTASTPRKAD